VLKDDSSIDDKDENDKDDNDSDLSQMNEKKISMHEAQVIVRQLNQSVDQMSQVVKGLDKKMCKNLQLVGGLVKDLDIARSKKESNMMLNSNYENSEQLSKGLSDSSYTNSEVLVRNYKEIVKDLSDFARKGLHLNQKDEKKVKTLKHKLNTANQDTVHRGVTMKKKQPFQIKK
jgi:hypothetical protein